MIRGRTQPLRRWSGTERPYDLIFEGTAAVVIVSILVVTASLIFGSADGGLSYPGGPPAKPGTAFTAQYWATSPTTDDKGNTDPNGGALDFASTIVTELDGSSPTAGYGPPFNKTTGASQHIGGVSLAGLAHNMMGLTQPINTANDFVLAPLRAIVAPYDPTVLRALSRYQGAGGSLVAGVSADKLTSDQQAAWLKNYTAALAHGSADHGTLTVAPGEYGPVPTLVQAELSIARSGALDGHFANSSGTQLTTNPYKATMFFSDGAVWSTVATGQGLTGNQYGVMNELWNYPGQFWLILYAIPYHLPAIGKSPAADLWVGTLLVIIGMLLQLALPWIPGLRDIPRALPLYKIIYRRYYTNTTQSS